MSVQTSQGLDQSTRTARRRRLITVLAWLLAPLLSSVAFLVHVEAHVPTSEMLPRPPDKKAERPRKEKSPRADLKVRNAMELAKSRAAWQNAPIEAEPTNTVFRRNHDSLLRAIVHLARTHAMPDKSVSLKITPHCHTVRCKLEVCGPSEAIDAIAEVLPRVERVDGRLWHELREVEASEPEPTKPRRTAKAEGEAEAEVETPERKPDPAKSCRAWVVAFTVDGTRRSELRVAELSGQPPAAEGGQPPAAEGGQPPAAEGLEQDSGDDELDDENELDDTN